MDDYFEHKINQGFAATLISFDCPECGEKFDEPIGRLKDKATLSCPACGFTAPLDPNPFGSIPDILRDHLLKGGQGSA